MAALTALGLGIGEGAFERAYLKSCPLMAPNAWTNRSANGTSSWTIGNSFPKTTCLLGGEPKQRLRYTLVDKEGNEHSWSDEASVGRTALIAYGGPEFKLKNDEESLVINAQLHPSSPLFKFNVAKQSIMDHIATLAVPSGLGDLASVKHITIVPDTNPSEPAKS